MTTAVFCGVRGTHDYPKADWIGAWVRPASTQRNGKLRGFNNWEPILLYGLNRLANDVWTYQNRQDKEAARHPTSKPVRLLRDMIGRLGGEDGAILDPFMGSGTTLVAAKLEGRKAVGIEIEERYCEIAANRLRQGTLF